MFSTRCLAVRHAEKHSAPVAYRHYLRLVVSVACLLAVGWLLLDAHSASAAFLRGGVL